MMTVFFHPGPVNRYEDAEASNTQSYSKYFAGMRERGIYLAPSQFECAFVSLAHTDNEIEEIVGAARESLEDVVHT
jgi:glutamate-1-semialdehyde 2,1-aminomutase